VVTERADLDESLTSVVQVDAYGQGTQRQVHELCVAFTARGYRSRHFLANVSTNLCPKGLADHRTTWLTA
jgi:hypothetical protein